MVRLITGLALAPVAGILGAVVAAFVLAVHDPGRIGIGLWWEALAGSLAGMVGGVLFDPFRRTVGRVFPPR